MKTIHFASLLVCLFHSTAVVAADPLTHSIEPRWFAVEPMNVEDAPLRTTPLLSRETWGWIIMGVGAVGVAQGFGILTGLADPVAITETKKGDPVRVGAYCNDGTTSNSTGSGACSGHGGVSSWRTSRPNREVITGYGDPTVDGLGIMTMGLAIAGGGYVLIRPRTGSKTMLTAEFSRPF